MLHVLQGVSEDGVRADECHGVTSSRVGDLLVAWAGPVEVDGARTARSWHWPGVQGSGSRRAASSARNWSTAAWSSGLRAPGAWPQPRKRRFIGGLLRGVGGAVGGRLEHARQVDVKVLDFDLAAALTEGAERIPVRPLALFQAKKPVLVAAVHRPRLVLACPGWKGLGQPEELFDCGRSRWLGTVQGIVRV